MSSFPSYNTTMGSDNGINLYKAVAGNLGFRSIFRRNRKQKNLKETQERLRGTREGEYLDKLVKLEERMTNMAKDPAHVDEFARALGQGISEEVTEKLSDEAILEYNKGQLREKVNNLLKYVDVKRKRKNLIQHDYIVIPKVDSLYEEVAKRATKKITSDIKDMGIGGQLEAELWVYEEVGNIIKEEKDSDKRNKITGIRNWYAQNQELLSEHLKEKRSRQRKTIGLAGLVTASVGAGIIGAMYFTNPGNASSNVQKDDDDDGDGLLNGENITLSNDDKLAIEYQENGIIHHENPDGTLTFFGEKTIGSNSNMADTDGDYIIDGKEVEAGLDPTKIYTHGDIDDFNRLYTYPDRLMPYSAENDTHFMADLPNVEARHWELDDGGIGGFSVEKCVLISSRDPLMKYFAKNSKIEWTTNSDGITIGHLLIDGENAFKGYPDISVSRIRQPSYFLTSGRKGGCADSQLTNFTILKMMGFEPKEVGIPNHTFTEVNINGEEKVVDFSGVFPKDWYYEVNNVTETD